MVSGPTSLPPNSVQTFDLPGGIRPQGQPRHVPEPSSQPPAPSRTPPPSPSQDQAGLNQTNGTDRVEISQGALESIQEPDTLGGLPAQTTVAVDEALFPEEQASAPPPAPSVAQSEPAPPSPIEGLAPGQFVDLTA